MVSSRNSPRRCIKCGEWHNAILYEVSTGDILEELLTCRDCLTQNMFCEFGGEARCIIADGRNVNMAEELNRLDKKIIQNLSR